MIRTLIVCWEMKDGGGK